MVAVGATIPRPDHLVKPFLRPQQRLTRSCAMRNNASMRKNPTIEKVTPGAVVLSEIGLMPTVRGLRDEFPSLAKSTVWRWSRSRKDGGTDGMVPHRYHVPLLRLARKLGRTLTPQDLVLGRRY